MKNALFGAVLGMALWVLPVVSRAQSAPEGAFCYAGNCTYQTLGEAEAALRASVPEGSRMVRVAERTRSNETVELVYKGLPTPPDKIYPPGFAAWIPGWSSPDGRPAMPDGVCPKSGTPYTGKTCATLEGAAQAVIDWVIADCNQNYKNAGLYPAWQCWGEPTGQILGSYPEPFFTSLVLSDTGPFRDGYLVDGLGGEVKVEWKRHRTGNPTDTFSIDVSRYRDYQCPVGYRGHSQPYKGYEESWPNLCTAISGERVITASNRKRCDPCQAVSDKPIFPSTGDKARFEPDFQFGGRSFTRNYHSVMQFDNSSIGPGWSTSFGMRLIRAADNSSIYEYLDASGFLDQFLPLRQAESVSKFGTGRILRQVTINNVTSFEVVLRSGEVQYFSNDGRLQAITHPGSPVSDLAFAYVGDQLTTVSDAQGRQLQFEYNDGKLSRALLPDGTSIDYGYDSDGNLVAIDYGNGQIKRYHYKEDEPVIGRASGSAADGYAYAPTGYRHLLTGITSEDGQRYATFKYDLLDRPVYSGLDTAAGPVNQTFATYQPGTPKTVLVTQESGEQRKYIYSADEKPRLTDIVGVTDPSRSLKFEYFDPRGRVTKATNAKGVSTVYVYGGDTSMAVTRASGRDEQSTVATDRSAVTNLPLERREYDATGALISKTTLTYNDRGQVSVETRTDAVSGATRTTSYTYCEDAGSCPLLGQLVSVDGPRTDVVDVTTFSYYPDDDFTCTTSPTTCAHRRGDLWKVTNALGQVTETLAYDGAGRPQSVKDINGVITDFEYHPRGWLTARKVRGTNASSETDDLITRIEYYPTGLVKKTTLPDGSYTTYTYDAAHRLTDITDAAGNRIHYTLDNAGNHIKEETFGTSGPALRTLSRVYDELGDLREQKDAKDHATKMTADANGNIVAIEDALERDTGNAYDPLDRLVQTIQDVGGINATTGFKYDSQDNLAEVTDPKGLKTKYSYNGFGEMTRLESPDTGVTTYTYDSAGNRKTQTDARGVTTAYGYDALNRVVSVTYPDSNVSQNYFWDEVVTACPVSEQFHKGRLSKLKNVPNTNYLRYCYDRFGNVTRKIQNVNGKVFSSIYSYTPSGQLKTLTYPASAMVVDYVRDALGRTTEVGVKRSGQSRQVLLTAASYYPFGPTSSNS